MVDMGGVSCDGGAWRVRARSVARLHGERYAPAWADVSPGPAAGLQVPFTPAGRAEGPSVDRGGTYTGSMLLRATVIIFSVIQTLLTFRLLLPVVDLPRAIEQYEPTLRALTDPLIGPFRGFSAPEALGSGFGRLDATVIVALIGWSIAELLVLAVLRVFARTQSS
jgi:uncharacterized protein YggT (Ycf19 family)